MCISLRDAVCCFGFVLLLAVPGADAGLSQDWFLFRARSNMEIRNYSAAIEAYRKVLEDAPHHQEALRGLGQAFEANGQTDEAIAAYDRYLARYDDDPEIAFRQANVLGWSRYAYRRGDAIRYFRMGLARKDDPAQRRKLARLLAEDKATLDEALVEYRVLLKRDSNDRTLASEYRKLLLWDERHLEEAIEVHRALVEARPSDRELSLLFTRLLARHPRYLGEAADRYAKLVETSPGNRALRLEFARVLARDPRRSREAAQQLRLATNGRWNHETRLMYADLLAARAEDRDEALEHYAVLVKQSPKNTAVRLKYARLLGAEKVTNDQAIAQYEQVLRQDAENATAHAGLARAYAWSGDSDRALHHEGLAVRYGAKEASLRQLADDLGTGREPRSGGGVELIAQPGSTFSLFGLRFPLAGRTELSPFVTGSASLGFESYFGDTGAARSGAFVSIGTQFRIDRTEALELDLGYQTVRGGVEGLRGRLEWTHQGEWLRLRPRFERQPRQDSFHALVGNEGSGAVSSNLLAARLERVEEKTRMWLDPQVGFIAGRGAAANLLVALDGAAEREIVRWTQWALGIGWDSRISHFGSDASALSRGGYFSPALHVVQTPILTVRSAEAERYSFELIAGPSVQYQLTHDDVGEFLPGGQARLATHYRITRELEASAGAAFMRMGSAYVRFDLGGQLSYVF